MEQALPDTREQAAPALPGGRDPILEIKDLHTYFFVEKKTLRAVNGVTLTLDRQSTLGIVGESGCGKSVTAMSVMRLIKDPPGKIAGGEILLHRRDGRGTVDLTKLDPRGPQIREIRGGEIVGERLDLELFGRRHMRSVYRS